MAHVDVARRLLPGMNLDSVRDARIRDVLERTEKMTAEANELRSQLRQWQQEKDKEVRKMAPSIDKQRDGFDREFDALQVEKDLLHRQMDKLKLEQNIVQSSRDQLRKIDFQLDPINKEIIELKRKAERLAEQHAQRVERRNGTLSTLPFKTVGDANAEIGKLEQKIASAAKKNETALVAQLSKQKEKAEKAKRDVLASYGLDEQIIADRDSMTKATTAIDEKTAERKDLEDKKKALRDELATVKNFNVEFDAIRTKLNTIAKKMDAIREKRKQAKDQQTGKDNTVVVSLAQQIADAKARRDQLVDEITRLRDSVPSVTLNFPPDMKGDIVGRQGATLQQLQTDFGVAIEFADGKDTLTIVGGEADCQEAKAAIEEMLENLKASRCQTVVKFDPTLAAGIIGSRGANVEKWQTMTGAKIKVASSDGTATITGRQEAVDAAKALLDEHVFNSASADMAFDRDMRDIVVGKQGATVKRIEEESGVKKIRVDRDNCLISFFGTKTAVEKAKQLYAELLKDLTTGGFQMHVDDRMIRLIIGKGGATINEIQTKSGALVNIKQNGTVTIRGGKDQVQLARRLIEEVTRRDEIKIPFESYLFQTLTTRPLVVPEGVDGDELVQKVEKNSPLEDLKLQSGCDQVSAIRGESKIVLRGKKECVNQARALLDELLRSLRPHTVTIPVPEVLSGYLTKRNTSDRTNKLDRLRQEYPALMALDYSRESGCLTVAGGQESVETAAAALKELVLDLSHGIKTMAIPSGAIGTVIGPGGSTIGEIQRKHRVEVNVNREAGEVTVFSSTADEGDIAGAIAMIEGLVKS